MLIVNKDGIKVIICSDVLCRRSDCLNRFVIFLRI